MKAAFQIFQTTAAACLLAAAAVAQSATVNDPARQALERIEAAVNAQTIAAERTIDAARLVRESVEAKKLGKTAEALAALAKAEHLANEGGEFQQSELVVALLRRIADERDRLAPKSLPNLATPANGNLARLAPRLALARYRAYRESLGLILAEQNLPPELLAVAMIESGFNPMALSPKGARGIWQLMPATASRYGLKVQAVEDQRTHPELSTRVAARYLNDLYHQFGDWKLALAAYNWGEGNVQRVIKKTGIRDFDEMARRGLLPEETSRYVTSVMAVWASLSGGGAASR